MEYVGKIATYVRNFEQDFHTVVGSYEFNQPKTLEKVDMYMNSQFLTGNKDKDGFKKFFFNIVKHRVAAAVKAIDIDTKDIRIIAEDSESYYKSWVFEKELRMFMKTEGFGEMLNEIGELAPRYGSVVVKDVDGVPEIAQLRNLVYDSTVESIESSPYVIERHYFSPDEYREMANEKGWMKTEDVLETYHSKNKGLIEVYECYCWLPTDKDETEWSKNRIFIAGLEFVDDDSKENKAYPIEISEKVEVDEYPYIEWQWDKTLGRALGVGVVEDLFGNQEQINEFYLLERKMYYWSAKKVFQTSDPTAPSNLFTAIENGQVLSLREPMTQVDMTTHSYPEFANLVERIERNADQRAFSFEVNTGESLPSGTPFRLGAILANAVNSHFALKRENFGLFIERIIWKFIVPAFKKKKRKEHILNFAGDSEQMAKMTEILIDAHLDKALKQQVKKTGKWPTVAEYDARRADLVERFAKNQSLFMKLPDDFYDDVKFRTDIVITGESKNVEASLETLATLLTTPIVAQDPAMTRNIIEKILNLAGENPIETLGMKPVASQPAANINIPAQSQFAAPQAPQGAV